jgi:LEA14-like dessication related protein
MKLSNILIFGGIAVIAYELLNLGTAAGTAQFLLEGVTVNSITNYTVQILVQNVSNANVTLNSLVADIQLNGTDIGNASYFPSTPTVISGNSQQVVNLTVNPSLLSLPGAIINIVNAPGSALNFNVTGNANVNGLVLPFTLTKTVTV